MQPLVRLYIVQSLIGFALAAGFVAGLMYWNVANLWYLITHTDAGPLALLLLWVFNGIVFSSVQFGIAIMRMQENDDSDHPRGGPKQMVPVRVAAEPNRRPQLR